MSQETTNRSFDDLARALAEGSISRRRALRLFAGSAIAALIPSRAMADDDCVKICHIPFERTSTGVVCHRNRAETRCVSRERVRFHLENHPCDCRGSCASTNKCRSATSTTSTSTTSTSTTSTTPMCIPPGGACPRGFECCRDAGGCLNHVCIPPGGGNLIECACVDNTGDAVFCSSAACGSSDLEQVCVALCATSGGVKALNCTACSTNCRCP